MEDLESLESYSTINRTNLPLGFNENCVSSYNSMMEYLLVFILKIQTFMRSSSLALSQGLHLNADLGLKMLHVLYY